MKMSSEISARMPLDLFQKNSAAFIAQPHALLTGSLAVRNLVQKRSHIQPILLKRVSAAMALDVSPATFDAWVERGLVPAGRRIGGLKMWSARELEQAAEDLIAGAVNENEEADLEAAFQDFQG
jgi:hypothetical protein